MNISNILILAAGLLFTASASALSPGEACTARDSDPVKCMACAIKGEDNKTLTGMLAVGGVIKTRASRGGGSVCAIVHAPGQFVGAWGRLPKGEMYNKVVAAARKAVSAPGNGYMGFRSYCRPGKGDIRIGAGGNCYRKKADALLPSHGLATDTPRDVAMQEIDMLLGTTKPASTAGMVQTAELPNSMTAH